MRDVGIPAGVYNVVHGFGPGSVGEQITAHPGIDAITFTGESRTGSAIMRAVAPHIKAVSFELGGKNPAIVRGRRPRRRGRRHPPARPSPTAARSASAQSVYVHRSLYDDFVEARAAGAEAMKIGDPMDPGTRMGPLISATQRDKVLSYFERAVADGATVRAGGRVPALGGDGCRRLLRHADRVDRPRRVERVHPRGDLRPGVPRAPFDDEDEVVALANDSDYGLCAALWTQDLTRAPRRRSSGDGDRVGQHLVPPRPPHPFGGVKLSGIGREGGTHSLDFYSELRNVCIKL